jgi:molybdopterin/thiamine biosynthesis adenylyltransferase
MREARFDRQLRIDGWNQEILEQARVAVVGDDDLLASLYVLSASALGLNTLIVLAPSLDERLLDTARRLNPRFNLVFGEGYYTHPILDDFFNGCSLIVDLSAYGLANKLLLAKAFREGIPIVRGFSSQLDDWAGCTVFTYRKGKEFQELDRLVSPRSLPAPHPADGVLDLLASGLALVETAALLMGRPSGGDIISYRRKSLGASRGDPRILVVGAGALGTFVGLGLVYAGFRTVTFMDPDVVEVTNLNRQVFFHDAVGSKKADALARRFEALFGIQARSRVDYLRGDTDLSPFDAVFDCVDNFETRLVLSEKCREEEKFLVSGGTGVDSGQVVPYRPGKDERTPAELLGLYQIVGRRQPRTSDRIRVSCAYQADPSVIMTNQIVAGLMVDTYRIIAAGEEPASIFYGPGAILVNPPETQHPH